MDNVTKERDEALDTIDDMVDTIADFDCTYCEGTARVLFGLLKKYAREEDTERIRTEWKEITGADIEEWR